MGLASLSDSVANFPNDMWGLRVADVQRIPWKPVAY
jgi:hypothetical protein